MLTKKRSKMGFTMVEVLVVMVILGILLAIAIPEFQNARYRAMYASLKGNMRYVQTSAETYSIDWGGMYPKNRDELFNEASNLGYWSNFKNPITTKYDPVKDATSINGLTDIDDGGSVIYVSSAFNPNTFWGGIINTTPTNSTYAVYGVDRNKAPLTSKDKTFFLSNQ